MSMRYVELILVAALLAAGCDKKQAMPVEQVEIPDVNKVFTQVDACMSAGDTNGALNLLTQAMDDKTYVRQRGWLYGYVLNILLMADRADEAKAKYLAVIGKDDELTRAGFGMLYSYYQRKGDDAALEAWVKQMVDAPLPKDMLVQAYAWHMGILRGKGEFDKVLALVPVCAKKFDAGTNRRLLGDLVAGELSTGQFDNAGKLLDVIEKEGGASQELKDLIVVNRTDILFLGGKWAEAEQQFVKVAPGVSDGELAVWFSRVIGRCVSQQQLDLADKLCDYMLKSRKDKTGAWHQAAMLWIEVAKARKDMAAVPVRLEALKGLALPPDILLSIYRNEFYTVMGDGKKADVTAMVAFGDRLEPLLTKDDDKGQVNTMALDGSFITEDYARSLKILEAGIAGRDKNWHAMAINKARAHLALKEGKPKEAVESFRKFMASVATWEKPEQDPITGILYSKEMCLGRNAKRIGDIWTGAGDAKAAADAYAEAKQYYDKALADVKADSKEAEVIRTETAEIGKPPAKSP